MGKTTTEMQLVAVSKLIPYVNNARTHSAEQIMKLRSSLREFGFINPVIIDREFNVIAGHGRILAAKEEGILEVPCVFVDYLTEAQKKAYILADNRMAMDAGWDEELLRIEIDGDVKKIRHVLYNCIASRPTIESSTKEDEIEVKTETLSITASPLSGGYVKARTSDTTTEEAYEGWYQAVYLPTDALGGSEVITEGGNA